MLKQQQIQEKELSGERKQNDGEVQTLQKQQKKLSGEIATYEEEWKALIAQYPKIPKAEAELKLLLPIYEDKAKNATGKLSQFNKIQKEIERLTQLKDKAVKDEAGYESKASTIQNKAQENASTCITKLAEQKALTANLISQQKSKEEAYGKAFQAWNSAKKEMEKWQEKYKQILNGEEPDAAEQRLTAAKDDATKAADNQNENINKLKAELANSKGSHQTMLSQNKTMKENLQTKEKELDLWIEEYNKQLEEKSIEGKTPKRLILKKKASRKEASSQTLSTEIPSGRCFTLSKTGMPSVGKRTKRRKPWPQLPPFTRVQKRRISSIWNISLPKPVMLS